MTASTIALGLLGWTMACTIAALVAFRLARILSRSPRIRESDQESAAHCHAELDGSGLPAGLIDHFHKSGDTHVG